jgi:hypothetical protein
MPRLLTPVFLVLFASLGAPFLSAQSTDSCPCTLRGAVVDSVSHNAIHGALIELEGRPALSTFTDGEGKFQLSGLPAGSLTLHASKPGYFGNDSSTQNRRAVSTIQLSVASSSISMKLVPEGVVFGKITDENGDPLQHISVSLSLRHPRVAAIPDNQLHADTDDEGNFRIAELPRGSYYLAIFQTPPPSLNSAENSGQSAAPEGFVPVAFPGVSDISNAVPIRITPGKSLQADLSLKRAPYIRVSGTLSGFSASKQVTISLQNKLSESASVSIPFNPATGSFVSPWFPPGSYSLIALIYERLAQDAFPNFSIASLPVNGNSSLTDLHLFLQPAMNIPVEIRGDYSPDPPPQDPSGFGEAFMTYQQNKAISVSLVPVGQADIHEPRDAIWVPHSPDSPEFPSFLVLGVTPGTYALKSVVTGPYYVESAVCGSIDLLRQNFVASSGYAPHIQITLRQGVASMNGSVKWDDPDASASILVFSSDSGRLLHSSSADSSGSFKISGLAPGSYRVVAIAHSSEGEADTPGFLSKVSSKIQEVTLSPGQDATLQLELATVDD